MSGQDSKSLQVNEQAALFAERRLALLVGVNAAQKSDKPLLEHAEQDVGLMEEALRQSCGFEQVQTITGKAATSDDVVEALVDTIHACGPDDFLLFYFSGHGVIRRGTHADDDDIYLVTTNFSWRVVEEMPERHLSLKTLRSLLYDRCPAGKVLILLDCCYAGNFSDHGPDLERESLVKHIEQYFDANTRKAVNPRAPHWTLAATVSNQVAYVQDGHGPLARWLLPALKGEVDDTIDYRDHVTLVSLQPYLQDKMREYPPSISGGGPVDAFILARHKKQRSSMNTSPTSYFPYERDPLFRPRLGEFETLESILLAEGDQPVRLGLVGMGGVGKSHLARELVLRTQEHFTDGVYWAATTLEGQLTEKGSPLVHGLAELAANAQYLPANEDPAYPSDELRARHLCRYLAQHLRALLVLDNVEHPRHIIEELPRLAGMPLRCAVLYTSREPFASPVVREHRVFPLSKEEDGLYLLLYGVRDHVLALEARGERSGELDAAHSICQRVGGLPLALRLLRTQLEQNLWLSVTELDNELRTSGVMAVARDEGAIERSVRAAFELSWKRVSDEQARRMFLLTACFPEALPIPLWLLALACDLPEDYRVQSSLMKARRVLQGLSLIEGIQREEIQMHPLLREFGREHIGVEERSQAAERVCAAFEDVQQLEQRARREGYWRCLAQVRIARSYVGALDAQMEARLQRVERRLDRESPLLANSGFWPELLPGLFYQQMHNRLLEEEAPLPVSLPTGSQWLRQLERVGIRDDGALRTFSGHSNSVRCAVFSPDGSRVLTGSDDATARIFDVASGETLLVLRGHKKAIYSVAYSPEGAHVLTGSLDNTVRLWDAQSGECVRIFEVREGGWVGSATVAAFSPDGELILTVLDNQTVQLWECATGSLRMARTFHRDKAWQHDLWGEKGESSEYFMPIISWVAFSPDGVQVALGGSGKVILWDIAKDTSHLIHDFRHPYAITGLAFTRVGDSLFIGTFQGEMVLWDCTQKAVVWQKDLDTYGDLSLALSHDPAETYILSGSWDGFVRLWETRSGKLLATSQQHISTIGSVAFAPNDQFVLVGSADAAARLYEKTTLFPSLDLDGGREGEQVSVPMGFYSARFSLDGAVLATYRAECMSLWDTKRRKALTEKAVKVSPVQHLYSLIFSPNGRPTIMVASFNQIDVLDARSRQRLRVTKLQGHERLMDAAGAAFSPNGLFLLGGSYSIGNACLWDTASGRVLKVLTGHTGRVECAAFAPDSRRFVTGSPDRTALLWTRQGNKYSKLLLSGHEGSVRTVAFSRDGAKVFTGAGDSLVRVWDAASGALLAVLDGKFGEPLLLESSPDSTMVLAGDMFNQVRIWRLSGDYELVAAFATRGRVIAAHWHDARTLWLVDGTATDGFPYMYTLQLM